MGDLSVLCLQERHLRVGISDLNREMNGREFRFADPAECSRMRRQLRSMNECLQVVQERIQAAKKRPALAPQTI